MALESPSNPFGNVPLNEDNPEPRCPCVLLLDTSASMQGARMAEMNLGLRAFKEEISKDDLAALRVEVAIITFGPVTVKQDFVSIGQFEPPTLEAVGNTPLGPAINLALDKLSERKALYRAKGIAFFRPWVFLITDGAPSPDDKVWQTAAQRVRDLEANKKVAFFSVGVENADMDVLSQISSRQPLKLKGLKFREMFVWLSSSLSRVSQSKPHEEVPLQSPMGWGGV